MNSQPDLSSRLAIDSQGVDTLRQSVRQNSPQSVKAVAQQFESLFMNTVMKSMREASAQEGGVFDNQQSKMFTSMLDQQLSQNMAKRGVGLADVLIRQLSPHGVVSPDEAAKNVAAGKNGTVGAVGSNALGANATSLAANTATNSTNVAHGTKAALTPSLVNNPYLNANKTSTISPKSNTNLNSGVNSAAGATNPASISPAKAKLLADMQALSEMDASLRIDSSKVGEDFSQLLSMSGSALAQLGQLNTQSASTKNGQVAPLNIDDWRSTHKSRGNNGLTSALNSVAEVSGNSRQPAHVREFQSKLSSQAEEASRSTGIPAKFLLGQAALESGWGRRELIGADGKASHNLFGIKATSGWKGKVVEAVTTEYVNGVPHARREKFRAYDSYADAFKDYGNLLSKNPRYENVIANSKDASSFARGLQKAGYATDPNYAAKLTRIINNSLSDTPSIAKNS